MRYLRILIFAMAVALPLLMFSSHTFGLQPSDPNEPNDDFASATLVEVPYRAENLQINPSGDRDVFKFVLEERAQVEISITADQVGSSLDPVMALLSEDGDVINRSDDVRGLDPLILAELTDGTYYVAIEGFFGLSTGFYDIEIFAQGLGDCIESELEANETESWNLGRVSGGTRVQVLLLGPDDTDFDLALIEIISDSPQVVATVDISLSLTSQERVSYSVQGDEPRELIAQVSSFSGAGPYTLCVSTAALGGE